MLAQAFLCYLFIACACAIVADRMTPGVIPGGIFTAMLTGIVGAWVGGILFGSIGPSLAGVSLVSSILGSVFLVFGLLVVSNAIKYKSI